MHSPTQHSSTCPPNAPCAQMLTLPFSPCPSVIPPMSFHRLVHLSIHLHTHRCILVSAGRPFTRSCSLGTELSHVVVWIVLASSVLEMKTPGHKRGTCLSEITTEGRKTGVKSSLAVCSWVSYLPFCVFIPPNIKHMHIKMSVGIKEKT